MDRRYFIASSNISNVFSFSHSLSREGWRLEHNLYYKIYKYWQVFFRSWDLKRWRAIRKYHWNLPVWLFSNGFLKLFYRLWSLLDFFGFFYSSSDGKTFDIICLETLAKRPCHLFMVLFCEAWNLYATQPFKVPLRFRKAERVWCGGARGTHWATCHNRMTPSKTKEFLESPAF